MEKTRNGNAITRSFVGSYSLYWAQVKNLTRLFDNGYTAAYYDDQQLVTYCEGDQAVITGSNLEQEKAEHLEFYRENN